MVVLIFYAKCFLVVKQRPGGTENIGAQRAKAMDSALRSIRYALALRPFCYLYTPDHCSIRQAMFHYRYTLARHITLGRMERAYEIAADGTSNSNSRIKRLSLPPHTSRHIFTSLVLHSQSIVLVPICRESDLE